MNKWIPQDVEIRINDYEHFPTAPLISLDLEYDEGDINDRDFGLVCCGIFDGRTCFVFFETRPELIEYLRKTTWIVHDGIHAELAVLNRLYGGFSPEQIQYDTKILAYTLDSSKKNYGLKSLVKECLGIEYPKYTAIVTDSGFIQQACSRDASLFTQLKKGPTLPKKLPLRHIDQEIVANYNAADTYWTYKLWQYLQQHTTLTAAHFYSTIEQPTNHLIYRMEQQGIKIDTSVVRRIHNETSKERRKELRVLHSLSRPDLNPNSPKQVLSVLQKIGVDVKKTDEDTIKRFGHVPFVASLLRYRGLNKLCSTYTVPLYFNAIKDSDNRIHAQFRQNTITGRLSSSDPINLQNQPKEVREAFVAADGHLLVGCDWTNIELYLPAHFSGEPKFLAEFSKPDGGDLHRVTAGNLYGEAVLSLPLESEEARGFRATAKTCNFLLTNSGSAKRLAVELGCGQKEAEEFYKKFWDGYSVLRDWTKETKRQAREAKGIQTMFGRWVPLPAIAWWCGRSNCPVFGPKGYFCKECFIREETERQAVSIKVQGSAADLCKSAALRLYREEGLVPVAMVHDELMYEVPENKAHDVAQKVKYVMENIVTLKVPLRAVAKVGRSWKDVH